MSKQLDEDTERAVYDLNAADNNLAYAIKEMHNKFGFAYNSFPRKLPEELKSFRVEALLEEVQEYADAETLDDHYDALLDILVFTIGAMEQHGFPLQDGFNEVMRANMTKEIGISDKPRSYYQAPDLVKPEGWKPPNLKSILLNYIEDIKLCRL